MKLSHTLLISLSTIVAAEDLQPSQDNLIVSAPSGTYRGVVNDSAPHVREFLGIPFAKPPTGDLRWIAPQKPESKLDHVFDATQYSASCPQYISKIPTFFSEVTTAYNIAGPVSEDCLALSIWTPAEANDLPVIVYIPGGGFQTGGTEENYLNPQNWVERTQEHIVVVLNYRLNIFGFPNAAGLDDQNLGILDQRLALEWVRDNIGAFGGDASKVTLWGHSAGGASTDYHNFAWYDDPIVTGFFGQSGTAFLPTVSVDPIQSNFSFVASGVGCDYPGDATKELECMRKVPWNDISDFVGEYMDSGETPTIAFFPVLDDKIVFSNYTERYATGKVSDRPAIFSTTEEEGNSLVPYDPSGVDETGSIEYTNSFFACPVAQTSQLRTEAELKTYRYLYSGDFANVSPPEWADAYHGSDLPMLFATHQDYTNGAGESTPFEFEVSEKMEDLLLTFVKDPVNGPEKKGWGSYADGKILRFAAGDQVVQAVSVDSVDGGVC